MFRAISTTLKVRILKLTLASFVCDSAYSYRMCFVYLTFLRSSVFSLANDIMLIRSV